MLRRCRRVALRISRTVFSALSGMRLLACLIVAPQRATMSQQSSLTQSAHSVRQVLTAYNTDLLFSGMMPACGSANIPDCLFSALRYALARLSHRCSSAGYDEPA